MSQRSGEFQITKGRDDRKITVSVFPSTVAQTAVVGASKLADTVSQTIGDVNAMTLFVGLFSKFTAAASNLRRLVEALTNSPRTFRDRCSLHAL